MARKDNFESALKETRKEIRTVINNQIMGYASEQTDKIANSFIKSMRNKLTSRASPSPESFPLLEQISSSIYKDYHQITRDNSSSQRTVPKIVIPMDPEGLVMFLEYGTGILGDQTEHPEAKQVGWAYKTGEDKYVRYNGKWGFIFQDLRSAGTRNNPRDHRTKEIFPKREKTTQYIDENDIVGLNEYSYRESNTQWITRHNKNGSVTRYVRRRPHGTKVVRYTRFRPHKIFSQGLRSTKFIYDTKMQFLDLIRNKIDYNKLGDKLKQLEVDYKE